MIGFQWIAIELPDGNFLAGKTGMLSVEISMAKSMNPNLDETKYIKEAISLFPSYPNANKDDGEEIFTQSELLEISKATNCIGGEGYHKHASDGIVIIPITRDKFTTVRELVS